MPSASRPNPASTAARTFRLPRSAYLVVLFLVFCTLPVAMAGDRTYGAIDEDASFGFASNTPFGPRLLLLLIPIAAAAFVVRAGTRVDADGIRVRALLGGRQLPWAQLRGLSVSGRSVYAVCPDGSVRLPCVRIGDLHALAAASGGHLPEIAEAPAKHAPSTHARRVRRS